MKIKKMKMAFAWAVLVWNMPSYALDLVDAYQRAQQFDPQWKADQLQYDVDQLNLGLAKGNLLPTVTVSGNVTRKHQTVPEANAAQNNTFLVPTTDTRQITVTARQPLFRWDAWQGYKQVKTSIELSEVSLRLQKQQHILQVSEAYFNVLRQQALTAAYTQEEQALSEQLRGMQAKLKEGLVAKSDVSEASAQHQNTVVNRISSQVQLLLAQEKLAEYIGDYQENLAVVRDDFQYQAPIPNQLSEWKTLATQHNLAILQARLQQRYAEDARRVEQASFYPQLEAFATYGNVKQSPSNMMSANGDFDQIGIEANWNLFTGGRNTTKVQQAQIQRQKADAQLDAAIRQAMTDTKQAYLQVETDDAKLKSRQAALQSAEWVAQASRAQYQEGLKNMVDVLLAQRNAFSAKTDYLQSKYDYFIHVLKLKAAVGQLTEQALMELNVWLKSESITTNSNVIKSSSGI